MERNDKLKMFANEIGYIKNENFRKFAEELIANADDYFFVVPASSSGKYHPQFSLGTSGLVRHTRCVAYFAKAMAESFNFNDEDTDLLIIAALAHDIKKQGNNTGHTVREHPLLASNYVCDIMKKFSEDIITNEQIQKICCAVVSHMGKWENLPEFTRGKEPYPMPANDFEKALQSADYIASRKAILEFDFPATDTVSLPVNESVGTNTIERPSVDSFSFNDLENYVIPFGKHSGKTFKEIISSGYLDWMARAENFNFKYEQSLAQRFLYLTDNIKYKQYAPADSNLGVSINDDLPF